MIYWARGKKSQLLKSSLTILLQLALIFNISENWSTRDMQKKSNLEAAPLRYAGVATLLRRPLVNDPSSVDIALIGVPYDGATENRPGPRHGPREIRNMSSLTRSVHHLTRVNPY